VSTVPLRLGARVLLSRGVSRRWRACSLAKNDLTGEVILELADKLHRNPVVEELDLSNHLFSEQDALFRLASQSHLKVLAICNTRFPGLGSAGLFEGFSRRYVAVVRALSCCAAVAAATPVSCAHDVVQVCAHNAAGCATMVLCSTTIQRLHMAQGYSYMKETAEALTRMLNANTSLVVRGGWCSHAARVCRVVSCRLVSSHRRRRRDGVPCSTSTCARRSWARQVSTPSSRA
jgi:hypothetical protein